jgi:hypothetical protein
MKPGIMESVEPVLKADGAIVTKDGMANYILTESEGYYSFYPTDFTQHIKPPEIIFTGFSLGDQLIKTG